MHARLAAALICVCGRALASADGTGSVPHGTHPAIPTEASAARTGDTRQAPVPVSPPAQVREGVRRAPAPPPADAAQRERGLMLAGIALMVGIALRRLGAGAP